MWKRIISVIGATLAVCIAVPATAGAASEYDDIIDKVSTKTLIHHIDNYSGKTCGSPDDDYAKKWLFAFKQKRYYSGDPKDHQAAVESLERAMSRRQRVRTRLFMSRTISITIRQTHIS